MTQGRHDGPPTLPAGLEAVQTDSGLEYFDVAPGDGMTGASGKTVRVSYRAWLLEGSLVDSSEEQGGPAEFVPGDGTVIPALEEGVVGMKVGGRRRLIVPSDLAYGPHGHGKRIPPYATLILDLDLLAVR